MTSQTADVVTVNAESGCTIDVSKYVSQLERRLLEQEQLITLLNEKIVRLESAPCPSSSYSGAPSFSSAVRSGASGVERGQIRTSSNDAGSSFVGSKRSDITTVNTMRVSQFFVSRLNPTLSAMELSKDLQKDVVELSSIKCCKLKTRHPGYSSFHVAVPEEQGQLLSSGDVWPEGSFIKWFTGKLLQSYILESFDSQSGEHKTFTKDISASATGEKKKKDAPISTKAAPDAGSKKPPARSSQARVSTEIGKPVTSPKISPKKNLRSKTATKVP